MHYKVKDSIRIGFIRIMGVAVVGVQVISHNEHLEYEFC